MPYRLKWTRNQVVFEYYGVVTSADVLSCNREFCGDSRFDELKWLVVLFDGVERAEYISKDIKTIAYMDMVASRSNPNITVLFVGDSSLLVEFHDEYIIHASDRCWTTIHLEDEEAIWGHIEKASV